ncbi:MAG: extracellular solute-binding protein [Clostridia bacterium]|nr:extracellular solute-binding protein [Clostridia bacterium]
MKKLCSLILVVSLLLSVCAGALAEDKKVIDHSAYSQFPLVEEGEEMTITVAHIRDAVYGVDVEDMWFWAWAEYATGIDFEVTQIPSNSRGDLLPLMFAGDNVPDLLLGLDLTTSEITRYGVGEGQLKDLSAWITSERMPYLTRWFAAYPESKVLCTTSDGAIYTLPGYHTIKSETGVAGRTAQLKASWLDANDLEVPKTLDELVNTLYAFKAANPDHTPIAARATEGESVMTIIINAFGFLGNHNDYGHNVSIKDGKAILAAGHPDFKAYLELAKQLYVDGILMKDYFSADDLAVQVLVQEDKAFMAGQVYHIIPEVERFQQWIPISPVTSEYCEEPVWLRSNPYKIGDALAGAKITDEKLDVLLRFLDFFYSDLGSRYTWSGPLAGSDDTLGIISGWKINPETGNREFLDVVDGKYSSGTEYVKGVVGANCHHFGNRSHSLDYPDVLTNSAEIQQYLEYHEISQVVPEKWSETSGDGWHRIHAYANIGTYAITGFPAITYYTEEQQNEIDEIRMIMEAHIETNVAKFITGARDLAEFDQFVKELEGLGLRDLEAIYQEAYDAYLAVK